MRNGLWFDVQRMTIIMKVNLRTSLTKFHFKIFEEVHSVIISKIITLESVFDVFSFLRLLRFKISKLSYRILFTVCCIFDAISYTTSSVAMMRLEEFPFVTEYNTESHSIVIESIQCWPNLI